MATSDHPWTRDFWLGDIDARTPALLRIGLASTLLIDWIDRVRDFGVLYAAGGIFPVDVLPATRWLVASGDGVAVALFTAGLVAIVALLVGWQSRAAAVGCWLWINLVQARNPFILDGADAVLRVLSFWAMWIDLGGAFSIDGRNARTARPLVRAIGVRMVELQLASIYLWSAIEKSGTTWHRLQALFYILQLNDFARPLGMALLKWPTLCAALTALVLGVEWSLFFLVYAPVQSRRTRPLALGLAFALHLGIFIAMRVGLFCLVMPVALTVLIPSRWWPSRLPSSSLPSLAGPRPRLTANGSASARRANSVLATFLLAQALLASWMIVWQKAPELPAPPRLLRRETWLLGLANRWTMFAPEPRREDGYWELRGRDRSARDIDLIASDLPGLREQGDLLFERWFALRLTLADGRNLQRYVAEYLCRAHADLAQVTLQYRARPTRLPGEASHSFVAAPPLALDCTAPLAPREALVADALSEPRGR